MAIHYVSTCIAERTDLAALASYSANVAAAVTRACVLCTSCGTSFSVTFQMAHARGMVCRQVLHVQGYVGYFKSLLYPITTCMAHMTYVEDTLRTCANLAAP